MAEKLFRFASLTLTCPAGGHASKLQTTDFKLFTKIAFFAETLLKTQLARSLLITKIVMKAKLNELKSNVIEWSCFILFVALEITVIYYTFKMFGAVK